jgi:TatD DNase family protein
MILTDTHTHLYAEEFDADRSEMMQRAFSKGVTRFFVPAIDSTCTQAMYELESNYPEKFFDDGIHPCYVKENYVEELRHIENELAQNENLCHWRNWH